MLKTEDIHTYYGDSYVLQGVSLHVGEGSVVAILGRNGMGKTTLIRSVIGFTPVRRGKVLFKGKDVTNVPDFKRTRMGIALVPQGRQIFPSPSVRENLLLGAREGGDWSLELVYDLFPRLKERAKHQGNKLSGGEQQMLAIARGIMANPRILLLDEPSMGLAPLLVKEIFQILRRINEEQETTMLVVEQNALMALSLARFGYVLELGRIVMDGPCRELMENEDVKEFYLGIKEETVRGTKRWKRKKKWR